METTAPYTAPDTVTTVKAAGLPPGGNGPPVRCLATAGPHHATELARRAIAEGADLILVLGGDGTVNEVVNGIAFSPVPLGVLPAGTANVLAMELGLGSRLERAARRLCDCVERRIALGKLTRRGVEPRYFLLMAGVGLDATIVTCVDPALKAKTGKLAYWVAGLGQLPKPVKQFIARAGDADLRCGYMLASRVRNYCGDMEIARAASLLSNYFEVVTFEGSNPLRYLGYFLAVGARCVEALPGVQKFRASEIECLGEVPVQVDGEHAGSAPAKFEIVPNALTLLIPPNYR